jgi:hypothetical protein
MHPHGIGQRLARQALVHTRHLYAVEERFFFITAHKMQHNCYVAFMLSIPWSAVSNFDGAQRAPLWA